MVDRYLRGVLGGENRVSQGRRERQYREYWRDRGHSETTVRSRSPHRLRPSSTSRSGQARERCRSTIRWLIGISRGVLGGENRVSQGRRERQYREYWRDRGR